MSGFHDFPVWLRHWMCFLHRFYRERPLLKKLVYVYPNLNFYHHKRHKDQVGVDLRGVVAGYQIEAPDKVRQTHLCEDDLLYDRRDQVHRSQAQLHRQSALAPVQHINAPIQMDI